MASWSRTFPGRPEQVAEARQFVGSVLAGRPEVNAAVLVASELCTNAISHSASGGPLGVFAVTVLRGEDRATVSVRDMGSLGEPTLMFSDGELAQSGRGLLLVGALAKDWGTSRLRSGRVVWAELASNNGEAERGR